MEFVLVISGYFMFNCINKYKWVSLNNQDNVRANKQLKN